MGVMPVHQRGDGVAVQVVEPAAVGRAGVARLQPRHLGEVGSGQQALLQLRRLGMGGIPDRLLRFVRRQFDDIEEFVVVELFFASQMQATGRDPRMLDGLITQNLSQTPAFFSSTSIIIIGGLFALLGTTDKAAELVREIPFAQPTPMLVFEFKILVLVSIFVYAFFRFSWSMRQYTFVALVIGAMPPPEEFTNQRFDRQHFAARAGNLVSAAAETFNDGLRAYYFSFAAMAWFFSPLALVMGTALVVLILYGREFRSDVLQVLRD